MFSENNILIYLKDNLSYNRYIHSVNVGEEAVKLAKFYGCDIEKARIAGLLHDCVKGKSRDIMLKYINNIKLDVDDVTLNITELLHAPAALYICKEIFNIFDEDILSAIRYHTTGKANMTLLQKIVFLADYIEPLRDFEGIDKLRELSYEDLDRALIYAFDLSIMFIIKKKAIIHPDTVFGRNFLIDIQ